MSANGQLPTWGYGQDRPHVMVEAAVRDFMLRMKGIDASAAFVERHTRLLEQETRGWSD